MLLSYERKGMEGCRYKAIVKSEVRRIESNTESNAESNVEWTSRARARARSKRKCHSYGVGCDAATIQR
jgi:hypothetical protein